VVSPSRSASKELRLEAAAVSYSNQPLVNIVQYLAQLCMLIVPIRLPQRLLVSTIYHFSAAPIGNFIDYPICDRRRHWSSSPINHKPRTGRLSLSLNTRRTKHNLGWHILVSVYFGFRPRGAARILSPPCPISNHIIGSGPDSRSVR
jgi:hypothetical protein